MTPDIHILTPVSHPANIPAIYHHLIGQAAADFKITWWIVFDYEFRQEGEDWKIRFSKSANEHLLINCHVSTCDLGPGPFTNSDILFHLNGMLDILEQQAQLLPEIRDHWIYFLSDTTILHPSFKKILTNGNEHTRLHIFAPSIYPPSIYKLVAHHIGTMCFKLSLLAGQRFLHPEVFYFLERLLLKYDYPYVEYHNKEDCYIDYFNSQSLTA